MESKLTQQIKTYCRLNLSNQYIREPKTLFYPKFVPLKPINFTKKCEKKSLKYFNADPLLNLNKNPSKQSAFFRKSSLRKNEHIRSPTRNVSNETSNKRIEFQKQITQMLMKPFPNAKQKFCKSLERQPLRKVQFKRNAIQELKNYQFKMKQTLKKQKAEPFQFTTIPKFLASRSSTNFNKSANLYHPNFYLKETKIPVSSPLLNSSNLSFNHNSKVSPIKYPQNTVISQGKNYFETNSLNLPFSQPIKLKRIPTFKSTQNFQTNQPQITKEVISNQIFTNQKKFNSSSQKLNNFFVDIQKQGGLKEELIASIEFKPISSHFENQPKVKTFKKQPESQKSTFVDSESKLRNIKTESNFFETINITKKSYFGQPSRTEQMIRHTEDFDDKKSFISGPLRKLENEIFSKFRTNEIFESKVHQQKEKEGFKDKRDLRENFRSIISVHSECESSSSSEASIIIDNHPKHMISARPIKTLF